MSIRIKDATPIDELQDHLLFAVGNTEGDTDGCVSLGQVKDFTDLDKATVAFTGSYLNLTDAPNLEAYVQMTTLQQNYYTRNQINQIIGGITGPKYVKVEELPEIGENNVIYLLPQEGGGQQNIFDEYVWLPDGLIYEKIGSTQADFDNYYDKEEVDALIPSVSNATITLQQGGVTKGTFTLNQSSNKTINLDESFVQEQADWDVEDPTAVDFIKNKPTIPTVNDPTMTFTQGGVTKGTFTLNQSQAETIEFDSQVQADWEQEDNSELDYIKNKPETLRLLFEYDDNTGEYIDFYIKGKERFIDYFYIKNEYAGQNTVSLICHGASAYWDNGQQAKSVEYSKDKTNWTTLTFVCNTPSDGDTINTVTTLEEGETVYFRREGNNGRWSSINDGYNYYVSFNAEHRHSAGGNILTLINYTTNPDQLQLYQGCFMRLFAGDQELISPPRLPLTNLVNYCYSGLFSGCTGLTTVPSDLLPATTLQQGCYQYLFSGCINLTKGPDLPASNLRNISMCYGEMYAGCSSLNEITIYADDIYSPAIINGVQTDYSCIWRWLSGVSATGTFHNLGTATYPTGVTGIPSGWTETNS